MRHFRKLSVRQSNQPTALKDVMPKFFETYQLKKPHQEANIKTSWLQMMGKPIADRTRRLFIQNKVLYVELSSAPLKQELSMSGNKVRDLLNQQMGENVLDKVIFI